MPNTAVVGFAFGDEGKGTIVDYLTRRDGAKLVVRFNGGPQAAHNVVLSDGRHHCFSQWGSGTLAGARTFLSRFMLTSIGALMAERDALQKIGVTSPEKMLVIDRDAIVITPYQVALNRLREVERGAARHGSCGRGIGVAVEDDLLHPNLTIRIRDLEDLFRLKEKLKRQQDAKIAGLETGTVGGIRLSREWLKYVSIIYGDDDNFAWDLYDGFQELKHRGLRVVDREWLRYQHDGTIFEGAQGVLLDQDYGFQPHTTWSKTTFDNADLLALEAWPNEQLCHVGVLRSYATRHGAGPFPTEMPLHIPTFEHNVTGEWQGPFRLGHFDGVLAAYAVEKCCRVDELAITHLDQVRSPWLACERYEHGLDDVKMGQFQMVNSLPWVLPKLRAFPDVEAFLHWIETQLHVPVTITSSGPTAEDKRTGVTA